MRCGSALRSRCGSTSCGRPIVPSCYPAAPRTRLRGLRALAGSAKPANCNACKQHDTDECSIDREGPSREPLEDAQEAPDRDEGREAGDDETNDQHRPAMRVEARVP